MEKEQGVVSGAARQPVEDWVTPHISVPVIEKEVLKVVEPLYAIFDVVAERMLGHPFHVPTDGVALRSLLQTLEKVPKERWFEFELRHLADIDLVSGGFTGVCVPPRVVKDNKVVL